MSTYAGIKASKRAALMAAMENAGLATHREEFVDHFEVLVEAQRIYQNRFDRYRDLPIKAMGAKGCLVQARTCVERLWAQWDTDLIKPTSNDAKDLINYAAHFIRQARRNNTDGSWWQVDGAGGTPTSPEDSDEDDAG